MSKIGVVTFPGSLDDGDAARAARISGAEVVRLWHADPDLHGVDAVVLPGGFSYGDYLRCGAIARFAPVMEAIADAARGGMPVMGICNGLRRADPQPAPALPQPRPVAAHGELLDGVDEPLHRGAGDPDPGEER